MSNKRASNMKNWAAIRRKARRIDQQRSAAGGMPMSPAPGYGATLINCVAENNGMGGIYIGPGASVGSLGGTYRNNGGPDVDNHGRFDSYGDRIGADENTR